MGPKVSIYSVFLAPTFCILICNSKNQEGGRDGFINSHASHDYLYTESQKSSCSFSIEISMETKSQPIAPSRDSPFERIPSNSWDSHMHVVDSVKYPLAKDAQYVPKQHLLSEALEFESTVRIRNLVLVQPSIYDYDNTCMLDALRLLGPQRARAVVAFDPNTTTPSTLHEWHSIGVRGVDRKSVV